MDRVLEIKILQRVGTGLVEGERAATANVVAIQDGYGTWGGWVEVMSKRSLNPNTRGETQFIQ